MDVTRQRFDQKDRSRLVFPTDAAVLIFGVLIFSVASFGLNQRFLSDPDTYWHIATGKWMLVERAFPRHDVFSHTAFGQPWVCPEWLAQVILSVGYDLFGWRGLVLLSALVTALTFA